MRAPHERLGPKTSAAVHVPGLFLALLAGLPQASSVSCPDSLNHQHCSYTSGLENTSGFTRPQTSGVSQTQTDLDCFGKPSVPFPQYRCTWSPSQDPSVRSYTLLIRQTMRRQTCRAHTNISGTSTTIKVIESHNMSAELFENSKSGSCRKGFFQGLPRSLVRCGPPDSVSFSWLAGRMAVSVTWQQVERQKIRHLAVRYRAQGSRLWRESPLRSKDAAAGTLESVNSSMAHAVQVRCVSDGVCAQCRWSPEHLVPPELTTPPRLHQSEDEDAAEQPGRRRLSLAWKFSSPEVPEGYRVTIGKASGESPRGEFKTTEPRITFILSYSSYQLEISAYNSASTSPPLRHTIQRREERLGLGAEEPEVTIHSNRSFTISLRDNLMGNYVCYFAEWTARGRKAAFMSYHSQNISRTLNLPEPLEPYRRYTLTLNVRPDKDTCNMKSVNNSESTYGSTQFYFMEGSPVGAPANLSSYNVTLDSAVLQWSSIPEEDARGFLLGYVIYYTGYQNETRTEENVTVNPDVNVHRLEGLKSGTLYEVQMSGLTRTGVGVRSEATAFTTDHHESSSFSGIIKSAAVITSVLLLGSAIIKRAKRTLWPSIPNPRKSSMMQKMQMSNNLELLQPISTLRVEQQDTDSLQIVPKEQATTARISADMPPLLEGSEDDFGDVRETHLKAAPAAPAGGYTTVEMFRQAVSASTPACRERGPDVTGLRSRLDYVRQFSTDSSWDTQAPQ